MNQILLNGDIYINIEDDNLLNLEDKKVSDKKDTELNFYEKREKFLNLIGKMDQMTQEAIHNKNEGFYRLWISDEGMFMIKETNMLVYNKERGFINLKDFLDKGVWVGRYLMPDKLWVPVYIVLYEYKDFWIVQEEEFGEFSVNHKMAFKKAGYKLGKVDEEFYQKDKVYKAIIRQELNRGLGRR